jgi:tetratricopeptide (TPR) repeat protein
MLNPPRSVLAAATLDVLMPHAAFLLNFSRKSLNRSWFLGLPKRICLLALVALLCACVALAQQTPKVTLDSNESLFSVLTAINACGYDQELGGSDPLRSSIRAQVAAKAKSSLDAQREVEGMCAFYRDHQQSDASRDLTQYVSLALNLGPPPKFDTTVKEADLPPDAAFVLGMLPHLRRFYEAAGLHALWQGMHPQYDAVLERANGPVTKLVLDTDVYLKIPVSGYLGRQYVVYVDAMGAPSKINARNYGNNYYLVVAPEKDGNLSPASYQQIRHTYLHFILDPLIQKRANLLKQLDPLLIPVKMAPMDEAFKNDVGLLVTESLIRALEARMNAGKGKEAERAKAQAAQHAAQEGFILAPYFNEQLAQFEKEPEGLQDSFGGWLRNIDVGRERKRANDIVFVNSSAPDVLSTAKQNKTSPLDDAEKRLQAGDVTGASEIASKVLSDKSDDPGRAMFVLAQVASHDKHFDQARDYFEEALKNTNSPRVLAWANVYLGRMYDLVWQHSHDAGDRDVAVQHYKAALEASARYPGARTAAERGIKEPYASPVQHTEEGGEQKNP